MNQAQVVRFFIAHILKVAAIRSKTSHRHPGNILKKFLFLGCLFYFTTGYPQSPVSYNLNELYDFNPKTIYGLYQAKDKQVWIATEQGLYGFNGTRFKRYNYPDTKNEFHNIYEDKEGRIWCSNFSGQLFYIENESLKLFKDINEYTSNGLLSFTVDFFPDICIGTSYGYIKTDFYNSTQTTHFQTPQRDKDRYRVLPLNDTIYKDPVYNLQQYGNKLIYRTTLTASGISMVNTLQEDSIQTLFTIDKKAKLSSFLTSHDNTVVFLMEPPGNTTHLYRYQNGSLQNKLFREFPRPVKTAFYYDTHLQKYWMGTYKGVFALDTTLKPAGPEFHFLKDHAVSAILRDHEGNYWFGTLHNGIHIIPSLQILVLHSGNSELLKDNILSMQKTDSEQLLLSDNLGNVYEYHSAKNKFFRKSNIGFGLNGIMVYNPIKNIIHFEDANYMYDLKTEKVKPFEFLTSIKAGTAIDSVHFLASSSGGTYVTNFKTGSANLPMDERWQKRFLLFKNNEAVNILRLRDIRSFTNAVCQSSGMFYVAYSDGLFAYHNAQEHPVTYNNKPFIITALASSLDKGVWAVNTEGRLFHILKHKVRPVANFSHEVRTILQQDSRLFLAGNAGIFTYDIQTGQKDVINTLDGLPSNTVTGLAIIRDTLYAATPKGLVRIPTSYRYRNTVPPEVEVTKMTVNGTIRDFNAPLHLKSRENNLSFFFNTYALRSRKNFTYAYRMYSADSVWTNIRANTVSFTALTPGRYTFQLKAVNEDGVQSRQIREVHFSIQSPFYQKWWLYTLISMVSIAIVSAFFLLQNATKRIKNATHKLCSHHVKSPDESTLYLQCPHVYSILNSEAGIGKGKQLSY